jgi:2-isopropylmalate synthase
MTTQKNTISKNDDNYVKIFDTTLRDGEQSPGASMNIEEKVQIAKVLEQLGVDVIEAGFPIASNGDFEAVEAVSKQASDKVVICGLARSGNADVDRAGEALKFAPRGRIHTFISTSPIHMKYKLQMQPEDVLEAVYASVARARDWTDDVEWSCEDGTRTERDFMCRTVEAAIKAGATTINIPDTVGYTLPEEYIEIITMLMNRVPNIDKAILSTHCHNDLGLAVANSLAGVQAGVRQVECTINGLGERAGNAALEEVVMALKTRQDLMPFKTGVDTTELTKASRMVSTITGFVVQNNKAIVGANAFAHESGIHQDGMLKRSDTYEIMTPESVGLSESKLVMGKHSGRHAFREKIKELGYDLGQNQVEDVFRRFKDLADKKKDVYDEDIVALIDDQVVRGEDVVKFVSLRLSCGSEEPPQADLVLDVDGEQVSASTSGDGPVDAIFNAIKQLIPVRPRLQLYQVHAVTHGTDAQAEVTVRLEQEGRTTNGQGADTDTMVASARAYVAAVNRLIQKMEKTAPSAISA